MEIKKQQIFILSLSMFIFTLGFGVIIPVIPYYSKNLGATAFDVGMLMAVFSAMQFICAPFWGGLSDRIGRKPILMIGLIGFGISFLVIGFSTHLWMLYIAEIIGGSLSAGIWPAVLAFIADITKPNERGGLMGLMGAASGLGIIFGPAISGFLTIWGLSIPFFAASAIAFINLFVSFALLPETRIAGKDSILKQKTDLSSTLVSLVTSIKTPLGFFFLLVLFISFAGAMIDGTFAFFVMDKFGLSENPSEIPLYNGKVTISGPGVMAIVFFFMGIIGIIVQGILVKRAIERYGEEKTILAGLVIASIALILLIFSSGLVTLILFTSLIGIGTSLVNPCLNAVISSRSDQEHQGEVLGIMGSYSSLGRIIGPPFGGFAFNINSLIPYIGSAIMAIFGAFSFAYIIRNKKANKQEEMTPAKPLIKV